MNSAKARFTVILIILCLLTSLCAADKPVTILVSFDGFRWDYPDRGLTPNLQDMAMKGVRAASLQPAFPTKTFPNHISMVSGLLPQHHGIILNTFLNPATGERYSYGKSSAGKNAKWYTGEMIWETARRNGVKTAAYFWPGSDIDDPDRQPDIFMPYKHDTPYTERVDKVLEWLALPEDERPQFITLYFHETDSQGHDFGPNSAQVDTAIALLDRQLGQLRRGIDRLGLKQRVNLIVVSDHGMMAVGQNNMIDIETILQGKKYLITDSSPIYFIYANDISVLEELRAYAKHYRVFTGDRIPDYLHFSENPMIAPIVVVADPGYILVNHKTKAEKQVKPEMAAHGYENYYLDMHGIFFAEGPSFKTGLRTGSIQTIDVYPLLCQLLNIMPAENIDGRMDGISFMLKPAANSSIK